MLDGFAKPDEAARQAAAMGQQALAITDHGECAGHLQHKKACEAAGIHPVYGMEGYWVPDIAAFREWYRPGVGKDDKYVIDPGNSHICLLAKDQRGLTNLWAWSSQAYEDSHRHYKPLADPALMRQYAEGLYASDACMLTDFARAVERDDEAACREYFGVLLDVFGDRFYSELHTWQMIDPQSEKDKRLNAVMTQTNLMKVRLANEMGVPLVVVNDSHYAQRQDWEYHRLTWRFNTSKNADQQEVRGQAADWMMNNNELYTYMANHGVHPDVVTEAIKNSHDIAMSCQVEIAPTMDMPRLTSTDAEDVSMFLDAVQAGYRRKIVARGLSEELYFPRLESECRLIVDKGFSSYFNVVQDMVGSFRDGSYIRWVNGSAGKTPRLCGPGRGSAGGSLVAYLMDITELDPIKYGLLFERFLTEDRADWPDVDTDVPQEARPDCKSYIHARYDHTCAIGTRSRSGVKATLRDLREPLDIPWADMTEIGKVLDQLDALKDTTGDEEMDEQDQLTWDEIIALKGGDLAPWSKKYPGLFEKMRRMTGLERQTSVHAAGVLIGNKAFLGRCPTRIKNDTRTTQFDMHEVEELGAVKMDVLGIRHLDTLEQARDLIHARHGIWLDYDSTEFGTPPSTARIIQFDQTQYADPAIWAQIDDGDTLGIFQLDTPLATDAAIKFNPRSERDVCDLISVNRPGVINAGQLPHYMARREGSERVVYDHPLMEAVTGPGWQADTYGILVYQEQMMRAAEVLAGFSPAERERLRKMIGKKQMDKMIATEGEFISRCLANPEFTDPFAGSKSPEQRARTVAEKIWRSLLASGSYAFNRSHGMGYGLVATWEIWTKFYFYPEFITALLRTDPKQTNRYLRSARRRGIEILPPHVNHSSERFALTADAIRYGLLAIAGVGEAKATKLIAAQPYTDFADFLARSGADKTTTINLVKIGACDDFGPREQLLLAYERHAILAARKGKTVRVDGHLVPKEALTEDQISAICEDALRTPTTDRQGTVIGPSKWIVEIPDFADEKVVLEIEKTLVGSYVTLDPMYRYVDMIEHNCIQRVADIRGRPKGTPIAIGGVCSKIKEITTKKGTKMAFVQVTWGDEEFDVTVFTEAWQQQKPYLHLDAPMVLNCIKDDRGVHLSNVIRLDWVADGRQQRSA